MRFPRLRWIAALLTASLLLATACGESDDDAAADTAEMNTADGDMDHSGMDMGDGEGMAMNMGDPDATRADEIEGAELVLGEFVLLETRPQGFDDTTGTAWMARHSGGTTVTVELAGLLPDTDYVSHVHADVCANDGGDHYQFEVGGSEFPPNEIHLAFTSDADGNGFMTAENDQVAGPEAVAFVVHPRELIDNKIACVDFATP